MSDQPPSNSPWHGLSPQKVLERLETAPDGLSALQVQTRLAEHGLNRLPEVPPKPAILRFLLHFHNILIYVLLVSALITAFLQHYIDTAVILAVVVVNAIIGYIQEGKAERAMSSISQMLALKARVVRDGQKQTIDAQDLVPGDIVLLESGDKVPADLRLIQTASFTVQEAALTGESVPVEKSTAAVALDAPLGDRSGMAFSGTIVATGQAQGVVVATGKSTEIGKITGLIQTVETLTTPLIRQMNLFAKWVTIFILLIAFLLLLFGYFVEHIEFSAMFMAVVSLSVSAIPEGLPAVFTITLAIGVQSMARQNAIVRVLPAIETLGSVSVVCTDKTGTLTRNEMMVATVLTQGRTYTVEGIGYDPSGTVHPAPAADQSYERLALACALNNDSTLHPGENGWTVQGDPMEGALLVLAAKSGQDLALIPQSHPRQAVIPFDAVHRYMATLNRLPDGETLVLVKGAPERILEMCRDQWTLAGQAESLQSEEWHRRAAEVAAQGQRILAFAFLKPKEPATNIDPEGLEDSLTFLGLVGMVDPPRPEAIEAVAECRQAGIRVKMVTGDHADTAIAIAKQIGLQNTGSVLTGQDLEAMDSVRLKEAVVDCDVFARTSPAQKLRLVMALQSLGYTVAMTGDGVNDAPALKRADAGIAMGLKGSEAAKEAADLVLADDNFATIAKAVREGRTVYDNIKKVISWTLPTNAGEAVTIIVALLLAKDLPITPVQILWINLVTTITLGLALAFEPTEPGTMQRPPRPRSQPLLTGELVWHIIFVSILFLLIVFGMFLYAMDRGYPLELARTIALNTLVVLEIFHLFFIRNIHGTSMVWQTVKGTKVVWACVVAIVAAQFAITYLPAMQAVFDTRPVSFTDGLLIVGVGVALFAIIETEKQIRLKIKPLIRPAEATDRNSL